jgi:8-oxo-dGTP pyrophosphatase MutT (NUDIX family)
MSLNHTFRLSSHAVITNANGEILLLRANYTDRSWGLPGGGLETGETIHQALVRECKEELNCDIHIHYLSGVYYHSAFNSQAFIFRASLNDNVAIKLSKEHSEYQYRHIDLLSDIQKQKVSECLAFNGIVYSDAF